jgi:hypothetical protein
VIPVEELESVLHPPDGQDLLAELDKAPRVCEQDRWPVHRRGRATIALGREDFWRPGRPGHAAHLEHSPTSEVSSGSFVDGQPRLAVLASSTALRHRSMGLSFGMAATPVTLGRPPRCSSAFFSPFFYFAPRNGCKICVYIYIYIYMHVCTYVYIHKCYSQP